MNVPNAITVARIGLIPVFLILSYGGTTGTAVAAFIVFGVASTSDWVDGYIARKRGIVSRLGEFLDPLADKLLIGAALVVLIDIRVFPVWAAVIVGTREIGVQVLRTRIVRDGGALPASQTAKLKTLLQVFMVCWWLVPWGTTNVVHWILLGAVLTATLWSAAEYVARYQRLKEKIGGKEVVS